MIITIMYIGLSVIKKCLSSNWVLCLISENSINSRKNKKTSGEYIYFKGSNFGMTRSIGLVYSLGNVVALEEKKGEEFYYSQDKTWLELVFEDQTYNTLNTYIHVSFLLVMVLLILAYVLSPKNTEFEKLTAYECGFEPYGDAHGTFNIQYYIVAILFIIFDLELAFLFPIAANMAAVGWLGYGNLIIFLGVLLAGFIYEWRRGALDWV